METGPTGPAGPTSKEDDDNEVTNGTSAPCAVLCVAACRIVGFTTKLHELELDSPLDCINEVTNDHGNAQCDLTDYP